MSSEANALLDGPFVESVRAYCTAHRLLPAEGPLIAAVSGGADSVALFYVLLALLGPDRLVVAHYNHRWRGAESDRDAAFVRALADSAGVRFAAASDPLDPVSGRPAAATESAARTARYRFLEGLSDEMGGCRIALAHHRDDQAETVLLNLLRGTALRGLCGMRPVSGRRIRPLLDQPRRAIEAYLAAAGRPHCEDRTNALPVTPRNRIRHELLPLMADICGGDASTRLAGIAARLAADEAALSERAAAFRAALGRADYWLIAPAVAARPAASDRPVAAAIISDTPAASDRTSVPTDADAIIDDESPAGAALPSGRSVAADSPGPGRRLCGLHFPLDRVRDLPSAVRSRVVLDGIAEVSGRHQDITSAVIARAEQVLMAEHPAAVTDLCHGIRLIIQRNDAGLIRMPPPFAGYAWLSSWAADWDAVCVPVLKAEDGESGSVLSWTADPSVCRQTISLVRPGLNEPLIFGVRPSFIEKQRVIQYNDLLWIGVCEPSGTRLTLRPRRPGDRCRAGIGRPSRPVKQWMQEAGVPLMWRDRLVVLAADDRVIWLPGIPGARFAGCLPPAGPETAGPRGPSDRRRGSDNPQGSRSLCKAPGGPDDLREPATAVGFSTAGRTANL